MNFKKLTVTTLWLCGLTGAAWSNVTTEFYDFNGNQAPVGWLGGGASSPSTNFKNGQLEFGTGYEAAFWIPRNLSNATKVIVEFDAAVYGRSLFQIGDITFGNQSRPSSGGGAVISGTGNSRISMSVDSSDGLSSTGTAQTVLAGSGTFHVVETLQNGNISLSVTDKVLGVVSSIQNAVSPYFRFGSDQNIFMQGNGGADPIGKFVIDNLKITTETTVARASKIFGLAVGLFSPDHPEQPGLVDGATDARNVFNVLSSKSGNQWATVSDGNTTNSLSLTLSSTDGKRRIKDSLAAMNVSAGDTVFFYYSGHGQSFASIGGAGESPVNIIDGYHSPTAPNAWLNNRSDETIQLGALYDGNAAHSDRYLSDDELAGIFLNDPKWIGVRKIFIVDACYGGGFWQTGASSDFGDLNKLDNTYFLAAAPETMKAHTLTDGSGLGLWTEKALLPALNRLGVNSTWDSLQREIDSNITAWNTHSGPDIFGVSYSKGDDVYGPFDGLQTISGFSARTSDFNVNVQVVETSVPEPGTIPLIILALAFMGLRLRRPKLY